MAVQKGYEKPGHKWFARIVDAAKGTYRYFYSAAEVAAYKAGKAGKSQLKAQYDQNGVRKNNLNKSAEGVANGIRSAGRNVKNFLDRDSNGRLTGKDAKMLARRARTEALRKTAPLRRSVKSKLNSIGGGVKKAFDIDRNGRVNLNDARRAIETPFVNAKIKRGVKKIKRWNDIVTRGGKSPTNQPSHVLLDGKLIRNDDLTKNYRKRHSDHQALLARKRAETEKSVKSQLRDSKYNEVKERIYKRQNAKAAADRRDRAAERGEAERRSHYQYANGGNRRRATNVNSENFFRSASEERLKSMLLNRGEGNPANMALAREELKRRRNVAARKRGNGTFSNRTLSANTLSGNTLSSNKAHKRRHN